MKPRLREIFDEQLERVLPELPQQVRDFMENVPLVVEDYPSPEIMRRVGVRHRSALCGLYTGIPLIKRSINDWGVPSDVIHIFRQGILSQARLPSGHIDGEELRKQIHFTILHEYGHHVGLSERDLRALGYG
ncbi:MAG TPA: metallopeptidase family protein [Lacipirellulaceae bacterium]|nr:metallopeptidase family protein [Lacipirellulaceae bacterium]